MENVKVAVTLAGGSMSILTFCTVGRGSILPDGAVWTDRERGLWSRPPSEMNIASEISRAFINSTVVSWRTVAQGDLPVGRDYRDSWVDTGQSVVHDMDSAKKLHLQALRRERNGELEKEDVTCLRLLSMNSDASVVEARRQALRDIPKKAAEVYVTVETIDQLKSVTLGSLLNS